MPGPVRVKKVKKENLKYWLALTRAKGARGAVKGINGRALRELAEKSIDLKDIFDGSVPAGADPSGLGIADKIRKIKRSDWEWVEKELERIKKNSVRVTTLADRDYPTPLLATHDPPLLLYIKGKPFEWDIPVVAVVGTRRPSPYGLAMAERIAGELAEAGVVVVSGMARGCDSAAHRGALSAGGKTVAVLGTGIDCVYPRENKALYEEIAERGLLMSELPMSSPPLPRNFPVRNRIISGLALGVVVVEAPLKSGAIMTAKLALDCGREVFAMPGQATSRKSAGTNKLIKEGAMLVEGAVDILDCFSLSYRPPSASKGAGTSRGPEAPGLGGTEQSIMDLLEAEPLHIDVLAEKTGLTPQRASSVLLDMELRGLVGQQPGKIFIRRF